MEENVLAQWETVRLSMRGPAAILMIDRPDRMNSLYSQVYVDLNAALDMIDADDRLRVVVLTGAGDRAFCAGGDKDLDVGDLNNHTPERSIAEHDLGQSVMRRLHRQARPVIGRVNGVAVGGGLDLVLLCDIVVAADHARFGSAWINRGIVPAFGGAWNLQRIIGRQRANDLVLTGRLVCSPEALAMGLVARVVPASELDDEVDALVEVLARHSAVALDLTKRLLREAADTSLESSLETSASYVFALSKTDAHRTEAQRVARDGFSTAAVADD